MLNRGIAERIVAKNKLFFQRWSYVNVVSMRSDVQVSEISDKGSGIINEDRALIGVGIFGVFDGATSLNKYQQNDGKTGGYLAAEIARETFEKNNKPLIELFKEANDNIERNMNSRGINTSDSANRWDTSVALVKMVADGIEWIRIKDSLILIIKKDGSIELLGEYFDHDLEIMKKWRKAASSRENNIFELLKPMTVANRQMANMTYGAMNGQRAAENFIQTGSYPLDDVEHILIFTDGAFIPKEDPESDDDWSLLADIFVKSGLEGIKSYVRKIEEADPNCWKYPRFKQHDDLTIVSLSFFGKR